MLQQKITHKYITFNFKQDDTVLTDAPLAGMTIRAAGTMRFRWNETNANRTEFLTALNAQKTFVPVELIHSHIVYDVASANDTKNLQGDGIITKNTQLIPTVTVADCMPLFLYDPVTKVFGIVHSGWKGTGIACDAIALANKNYGSRAEDFCVIIGPHIHDCCYIVNQERADFFAKEFTPDCVRELEEGGGCYCGGRGFPVAWNNGGGKLFRLSLEKANLAALLKCGVKLQNINAIKECTCCDDKFGSNRRETVQFQQPDKFTVQAAFINL